MRKNVQWSVELAQARAQKCGSIGELAHRYPGAASFLRRRKINPLIGKSCQTEDDAIDSGCDFHTLINCWTGGLAAACPETLGTDVLATFRITKVHGDEDASNPMREIERLATLCQRLHDAAYDNQDDDQVVLIDKQIAELKKRIDAIKAGET